MFTPDQDVSSKYVSPEKAHKKDFSLANLKMGKLSGHNSTNKENTMVDHMVKLSSPSKTPNYDSGLHEYDLNKKVKTNSKLEEYLKSSKRTSPQSTRQGSRMNKSVTKPRPKVKPTGLKGSKSTNSISYSQKSKGRNVSSISKATTIKYDAKSTERKMK